MPEPSGLLAAISAERENLQRLLAAADPARFAERPAPGKWSIVEHLRHLLFAEQAHLGALIPGGHRFSPMALPPRGLQGKPQVGVSGQEPTTDTAAVFEAWRKAHALTCEAFPLEAEGAAFALDKNLRHLRNHLRVIERLIVGPHSTPSRA